MMLITIQLSLQLFLGSIKNQENLLEEIFGLQSGVEIKCKHNRMIFFPSYYLHKVTPVLMNHQDRDQGLGRFSITNFFWNHQS